MRERNDKLCSNKYAAAGLVTHQQLYTGCVRQWVLSNYIDWFSYTFSRTSSNRLFLEIVPPGGYARKLLLFQDTFYPPPPPSIKYQRLSLLIENYRIS